MLCCVVCSLSPCCCVCFVLLLHAHPADIFRRPPKQEKSREKDGRVTTETTKHEHHEEIDDEEVPDDGQHSDTSSIHEVTKETKKNYTHVKDEDEVRDSFCASKKSYNFLKFLKFIRRDTNAIY